MFLKIVFFCFIYCYVDNVVGGQILKVFVDEQVVVDFWCIGFGVVGGVVIVYVVDDYVDVLVDFGLQFGFGNGLCFFYEVVLVVLFYFVGDVIG